MCVNPSHYLSERAVLVVCFQGRGPLLQKHFRVLLFGVICQHLAERRTNQINGA